MYGNEQSQYTMNRAAYGDVPAAMMAGSNTIYGGAAMGMQNMLGDIGGAVMPVGYMPPARVNVGFYGQYQQRTGFFSSGMGVVGLGAPGRSQMAADYNYNVASDFGERLGGGMAGLATSVGGMGVGALMGRFMGGGIIAGIGGSLVGGAVAGAVMDAVGQRREIANYLESSSYRYATTGANLGDHGRAGFGSKARMGVTNMIREMDIKDPFMSTEDLTMVLQQGTQKGMFAGTGGMDDFKKKFKDLVDTVKVTTRTLNQSLEEAMTTIKELKSVGIDPSQAKNIIGSADNLGRMAGRTGAEMLNIGLQGAEFFRGTGITMGIGAQATMMNLASVRAGRDAKTISDETIAQAGGEESLAMRMNASGLSFAQSMVGRGLGAAYMGQGGAFDPSKFMNQMTGGGQGMVGLAQTAAGNLSSPASLIAYQANQEKFMSEVGKTFGGQGLQMMQMNFGMAQGSWLAAQVGGKFEDSFRLSLKQQGMSNPEIETMIGRARGADKIKASADLAAEQTYHRNLAEESYRNNDYVQFGARVRDVGKKVIDVAAGPISEGIEYIKNKIIDVKDAAEGIHQGSVSGINMTRSIAGGTAQDTRVRSLARSGLQSLTGGKTAGTVLAQTLTPEMREAFGIDITNVHTGRLSGGVITSAPLKEGHVLISGSEAYGTSYDPKQAQNQIKGWSYSPEELKVAQEKGVLKNVKGGDLGTILSSARLGHGTLKEIAMAAYGKGPSELTTEQVMKLDVATQGTTLHDEVVKGRELAGATGNASRAVKAEAFIKATEAYHSASDAIRSSVTGGSKLSGEAIQLIASMKNSTDSRSRATAELDLKKELIKNFKADEANDVITEVMNSKSIGSHTKGLADAHETIKATRAVISNDRMVESLVRAKKLGGAVSNTELAQTEVDASAIASAKTSGDYMKAVTEAGEHKSLGSDPVSTQLKKNVTLLKALDKTDAGHIGNLTAKFKDAGILDEAKIEKIQNVFRDQGKQAAMNMVVADMHEQKAPTNVSTAGSKGGVDGGASASQVMEQQMNLNEATLQAMLELEKRLRGGKH